MCKRFHMIKVYENGSLVLAWPLSGPMNACLLLFCRSRHWQSLTRQWLSHQHIEPAADRGQPHQTRLSRGPAREPWQQTPPDPHLQLSSRHPPLCSQPLPPLRKDVLPGPHFPLCSPPPPLSLSQVVLVLTSSLPRHKRLLKCLRMLYGCMTRGGWHCWGSESIQNVNEIHSALLSAQGWVTLDLNCMMFEL